MKFVGHFLAFLLASALSLAVGSWIIGQTLWSAPYLEHQATQTKLYANLAAALPQTFTTNPDDPQIDLTGLNPALIQTQVESLLPQFIDHIHKSGPAPTLDLTSLAAALGQPAPDGATTQVVTVGPPSTDANVVKAGQDLNTVGQYSPLAVIVLVLLIVGVMRDRRFPTLARAAFETAGALAVSAGLFWLLPSLLSNALSKPTLLAVRDAITPFITAVTHGLAGQFGIAALVFIVVGAVLELIHGAARLKAKFTPKPKMPPQTAPTAPPSGRL